MRPAPSLADLLAIVRKVLRDDLARKLDGGDRYKALMAANAMAIVSRQIAAGEDAVKAERGRLAALLGIDGDLVQLNRGLAHRIREGAYPPGTADAATVHRHLLESVKAQLRESNPGAMAILDDA